MVQDLAESNNTFWEQQAIVLQEYFEEYYFVSYQNDLMRQMSLIAESTLLVTILGFVIQNLTQHLQWLC